MTPRPHCAAVVLWLTLAACGSAEPAASAPPRQPVAPSADPTPVPESTPVPEVVVASPAGPCSTDAECGFDDPCVPTHCVNAPTPSIACAESIPAPGTCSCFEGRCALRPHAERGEVTSDEACSHTVPCGLDLARGTCEPRASTEPPSAPRDRGPTCTCVDARCHFRWVEPIACRDVRDCWVDDRGRPVARPERLRRRQFRPCVDGERVPTCVEGACAVAVAAC